MAEVVADVMDRLGSGGAAIAIEDVYAADDNARRLADELVAIRSAKTVAG
jgi:hypothetical protein